MAKNKFYAIREGHKVGIFTTWAEAKKYVHNFPGADYKSFTKRVDAEKWLAKKMVNGKESAEVVTKKVSKEELDKYIKGAYSHHHTPKTPFDKYIK